MFAVLVNHVPPGNPLFWLQSCISVFFMVMVDLIIAAYTSWGSHVWQYWEAQGE